MFPGPLNFIKRFMKIGRRKMENYRKTWPERYGQEEINFHNKQVGLQVSTTFTKFHLINQNKISIRHNKDIKADDPR